MKRPIALALMIGFAVALIIGALHGLGLFSAIERPIAGLISHVRRIDNSLAEYWQYFSILILALGIAALTGASRHRMQIAWLAGALVLEVLLLVWICALYHVLFQPFPSLLTIALAFVAVERTIVLSTRSRSTLARAFFAGRLSSDHVQHIIEDDTDLDFRPKTYDATVVVCDIANKYELADESDPSAFVEATAKFIRRASDSFLKAGAYLEAADGEGVVAIFGFPNANREHAEKAIRVALNLVDEFLKASRQNNGELASECDIHLGLDSGPMIVAPLQNDGNQTLLASGEPIELARRFCVANRFYGSRILIGPRTFELASKMIVARPIDFLSGVNSQERHEIYQPLWLAAEAKPEHLARRDYFWNGVVLYREKRWAEAYSEFQKARGPDAEEDAPLQLYLRRLEPLALHLTESPFG
ncbi:MAG: adenylate/guanylate cyclase domain-containing protein [Chthoniobacterales bacterium]